MDTLSISREQTAGTVAGSPDRPVYAVVGFDGSASSLRALDTAARLLNDRPGGMEIVYDDATLQSYVSRATAAGPGQPVLIDRFLDDAIEIDVDALYDVYRLELLQDAVDTGARYAPAAVTERLLELEGGQSAALLGHQVDQLAASAAAAIARVSESGQRAFCPLLLLGCLIHGRRV